MQVWRNKVWVSCCVILGLHQITQKVLGYNLGILDNYLDPFLGMPILLGLLLQERQFLLTRFFSLQKPIKYKFSILETIITTLFFAIIFEEGFPKWSVQFIKDYLDYLAYGCGALIFYNFINTKE